MPQSPTANPCVSFHAKNFWSMEISEKNLTLDNCNLSIRKNLIYLRENQYAEISINLLPYEQKEECALL